MKVMTSLGEDAHAIRSGWGCGVSYGDGGGSGYCYGRGGSGNAFGDGAPYGTGDVAEWENVPRLTEGAWAAVSDAIYDYRCKLARDLRQWESLHDIDTVELLERAQ